MDIGLLILRLTLAAVLFAHATQKGLGWFSGPGFVGATAIFDRLGQRPARAMVTVAVSCEAVAGVLIGLGVGTPLGSAVASGTMLVAASAMTRLTGTVWNSVGGGEYPYVLAATATALGFTGAGTLSVDEWLAPPWCALTVDPAPWVGSSAVVVAVLAALVPILRTSRD